MSEETKTKPIAEAKIGGVKAAIWQNTGEKGPFYSVSLGRLYKKDDGSKWKTSPYLNKEDLLTARKVLDQAFDKIEQLEQA